MKEASIIMCSILDTYRKMHVPVFDNKTEHGIDPVMGNPRRNPGCPLRIIVLHSRENRRESSDITDIKVATCITLIITQH